MSHAILGVVAAIDFSYNADGIRTEKYYYDHEIPSVRRVKYILDGTKILSETCEDAVAGETRTLYFFYDEQGDVAGFEYNGRAYFYQKNILGDVLRLCDDNGSVVAEYTYDAWGKVLSITDAKGNAITSETHVANLNPFRYRSYYYDTETGLYYLNSRYYDPEVGRFLNADGIVGANGGITGYNLFAYCNNNPVMLYDPSGNTSAIRLDDRSSLGFRDPWRDASGAGGVSARSGVGIRSRSEVLNNILEDINNFRLFNTSEEKTLESHYFSNYKGVPVIRLPIGEDAFSFGVMFIGDKVNKAVSVQHEYGHSLHFADIGPVNYTFTVAIPSLYGYWTDVPYDSYYSQPWEYTADRLGGVVDRKNTKEANYTYSEQAVQGWKRYYFITKFSPTPFF